MNIDLTSIAVSNPFVEPFSLRELVIAKGKIFENIPFKSNEKISILGLASISNMFRNKLDCIPCSDSEKKYRDMIDRLGIKRIRIELIISNLLEKETFIKTMKDSLYSSAWDDSIFQPFLDSEKVLYPYYALYGLKKGLLSPEEFEIIILHWNIRSQKYQSFTSISLFIANDLTISLNSKAIDIIKKTIPKERHSFIQNIFEQMKSKHRLHQQFFLLKKNKESFYTIRNVTKSYESNLFGSFSEKNEDFELLLPSSLLNTTMIVFEGENAPKMYPVLFTSTLHHMIRSEKKGYREISYAFPGSPLPKKVDNINAELLDVPYHDYYHAYKMCSLPQSLRSFLIDIAIQLRMISVEYPKNSRLSLLVVAFKLIDMEILTDLGILQKEFNDLIPSEQGYFALIFWSHLIYFSRKLDKIIIDQITSYLVTHPFCDLIQISEETFSSFFGLVDWLEKSEDINSPNYYQLAHIHDSLSEIYKNPLFQSFGNKLLESNL